MWVKRALWQELVERNAALHADNAHYRERHTTQKVTVDWLMVRLTQLEHERAALIQRYMGVTIAVPSIEAAPVPGTASQLPDSVSFEDMGDEAAKAAGIDWNEHGEVKYTK